MNRTLTIHAREFGPGSGRTPRSAAYRLGALHALESRLVEYRGLKCSHPPGTAEFDAYWAGVQEGNALANAELNCDNVTVIDWRKDLERTGVPSGTSPVPKNST